MKGCIIFLGESFRLGGQNNRNIGSDESYEAQIIACKSHFTFIKYIEEKCKIDVCVSTYNTKFNDNLLDVYGNYIIRSDFYNNRMGTRALLYNTIKNLDTSVYDFILLSRIDICFKEQFNTVYNAYWDTIRFASICFTVNNSHKCGIYPRVNPILIHIPKKYYKYIEHLDISTHDIWAYLIVNTDIETKDLDTMLPTYHDSDSFKDWNPIYYIVNREQCQVYKSPGELFNKNNFN